jgi:Cu(I)/Ag(I) efflux system membrane fusion protein
VVTTGNLLIDAQAQLDHGGSLHEHGESSHEPAPTEAAPKMPHQPLTEAQRAAADELLAVADEIAAGLAADDLKKFNAVVDKAHPLAAKLSEAFGTTAAPVSSSMHMNRSSDLAGARKEFYAFSKATAQFALALRQHDQQAFAKVHVYECPMVKDAVPSAIEKKGRWMQLTPELRNPFFGAEMLECGVEVKP